jgi:hypothetical protein
VAISREIARDTLKILFDDFSISDQQILRILLDLHFQETQEVCMAIEDSFDFGIL